MPVIQAGREATAESRATPRISDTACRVVGAMTTGAMRGVLAIAEFPGLPFQSEKQFRPNHCPRCTRESKPRSGLVAHDQRDQEKPCGGILNGNVLEQLKLSLDQQAAGVYV